MKPEQGDEALRRSRISLPHADYFLTLCVELRIAGLAGETIASALKAENPAIEAAGYWHVRGAVIMPDHLHLLVTLHEKLSLSRVIARFKSRTKATLGAASLQWQGNYYEHRLREKTDVDAVLPYLLLNPYRAAWSRSTTATSGSGWERRKPVGTRRDWMTANRSLSGSDKNVARASSPPTHSAGNWVCSRTPARPPVRIGVLPSFLFPGFRVFSTATILPCPSIIRPDSRAWRTPCTWKMKCC